MVKNHKYSERTDAIFQESKTERAKRRIINVELRGRTEEHTEYRNLNGERITIGMNWV